MGLVDTSGRLCALIVWTPQPDDRETWRSNVLAVRNGFKRHGLAYRLKSELLDRAQRAGVLVIVSTVHRDNDSMLGLNDKFHAHLDVMPGSPDHFICTVRVADASI